MIVQHISPRQARLLAVRERADEIAVILVLEGVRHHHAFHLHGIDGEGENIGQPRMARVAVGNIHRQRQAVDGLAAVRSSC